MDTSLMPKFDVIEILQVRDSLGGVSQEKVIIGEIQGWLDLLSGEETLKYNSNVSESTHVLITDYNPNINRGYLIRDKNTNVEYEITFVDNPVSINHHLEIYLKWIDDSE